jgi:hypothetical protein
MRYYLPHLRLKREGVSQKILVLIDKSIEFEILSNTEICDPSVIETLFIIHNISKWSWWMWNLNCQQHMKIRISKTNKICSSAWNFSAITAPSTQIWISLWLFSFLMLVLIQISNNLNSLNYQNISEFLKFTPSKIFSNCFVNYSCLLTALTPEMLPK